MEYTPVLVGAGVGLADGLVGTMVAKQRAGAGGSTHTWVYAHTIFRGAVFAAGLLGEMIGSFDPDITYGLMTSSLTLIGSRLPAAFGAGPTALGDVSQRQRIVHSGAGAAGCATCSGVSPLATLGAPRITAAHQAAGRVA